MRIVSAWDFMLYYPSLTTRLQWQQWLNYSGQNWPKNSYVWSFFPTHLQTKPSKICKYMLRKDSMNEWLHLFGGTHTTIVQHIFITHMFSDQTAHPKLFWWCKCYIIKYQSIVEHCIRNLNQGFMPFSHITHTQTISCGLYSKS